MATNGGIISRRVRISVSEGGECLRVRVFKCMSVRVSDLGVSFVFESMSDE